MGSEGMGAALSFLAAGGNSGAFLRNLDWSKTALGHPSTWPAALQTLTNVMLRAHQPMCIIWGGHRSLIYNDKYAPLMGRTQEQTQGRNFFDAVPGMEDAISPMFDSVFAGNSIQMDDLTLQVSRGGKTEEAHYAFSYTPVFADDGEIAGLFCVCTETTDRVHSERKAAAEIARQSRLFGQMPGFVGILSGPDHVYHYVNDAYIDISGQRDFIGRTVRDVFPELEGQGFYELLDQVYRSGERFVTRAIPIRLTGDSEPRFIDLLYEPMRDGDGAVSGIFVGGYDASDAHRAAMALKRLNETLEQRVEQRTQELRDSLDFARLAFSAVGGVGVWTYDIAADMFSYDAAIAELYDLDPEQGFDGIRRQDFLANLHPDDVAALNKTMSGGLVKSGDLELEYRIHHSDGTIRYVLAKGHTYFNDEGEPVRRTGVSVDMTNKRLLEEQIRQSQKMEAVGQLSGGLAHDFNNLLAGIGGSLNMMQTRMAQGRIGDLDRYITAAQGAVKRGASLTQRMLAFSRRQTLDPQATDVNRLVNGMLELVGRSVGPSIDVETVAAAGLWTTFVDAGQLENALLNLCINARDAMSDGGKLTIETANRWMDERTGRERGLAPGQYVSLCVSDNGTGMSAAAVSRAYDPFFTTKPVGQGTGLGLSMVHGFAGQSGGATRIYSELGKGTMVCIYLPRHMGDATIEEMPEPAEAPRADNRETILLVDDEPLVRMIAAEQLDELGYHVLEAGDGAAALKILDTQSSIDLLITDVGLPNGMNGRQLADAARGKQPALKILYITGYAENAVLNHGHLEAGMEVMTKPFEMDAFARRVKMMIADAGAE